MRFEFATATRILFGAGTLREAGQIAAGLGRRALVVTGRTPERARRLLDGLRRERRRRCRCSRLRGASTDVGRGSAGPGGGPRRRHRLRRWQRARRGQGHCGPADQRRRPARLPGGHRRRPAADLAAAPVHRHAHHGGHRLRGDAQRGAVSPEHRVKVSLRSPLMLPRAGPDRPGADARPAARDHREYRTRCPDPALEPFVSPAANP